MSLDEIRRRALEGLQDGLDDVAEAILSEGNAVISREALDRGDLLSSGEVRRPSPVSRVVAWTAEHSVYVHYGTRPHWPPFKPIREWVERNLRINPDLTSILKPRLRKGTSSPTTEEVDRVARAVQAKIAKEGTEAVPYATRAASVVRPKASSIVSRAIQNRLR